MSRSVTPILLGLASLAHWALHAPVFAKKAGDPVQATVTEVTFNGNACPQAKGGKLTLALGPDGGSLEGPFPAVDLASLPGKGFKRGICSAIISVKHPSDMQFRVTGVSGKASAAAAKKGDVIAFKTNFQGQRETASAERDLAEAPLGQDGAWTVALKDAPWSPCGGTATTFTVGLSALSRTGTAVAVQEGSTISVAWKPCPITIK